MVDDLAQRQLRIDASPAGKGVDAEHKKNIICVHAKAATPDGITSHSV
jgi:hypothetical protein